jgi:hypothetical protein
VHASVVKREELAIYVEQGDRATANFHDRCLPGREIGYVCDFDKLRHCNSLRRLAGLDASSEFNLQVASIVRPRKLKLAL